MKLWRYIKSLFDDGYIHEEGYLPYKITDRVKFRDDFSGFELNLDNPEVQERIKKIIEWGLSNADREHL
jgi:hypothetical protein